MGFTEQYKGYGIEARPFELEQGGWNTNVHLSRDHGGERSVKLVTAGNHWPTEEEAIQACLQFGREVIDGKHPNCDISDL